MSSPTVDQVIMYDQALITWLTNSLPPLIEGRSTKILIAISRKGFAEVTSGVVVENKRLTLPRIVITKLGVRNDPTRFNSNRIRRLGWCNSNTQNALKSGRHPVPVNIEYQIDLWTRFVSEMNLWEQEVMSQFAPTYKYLTIRPDDVWGDKRYATFMDGEIADNSDLEPGEGERQIRRTFSLRSEGWLFDQKLIAVNIVKRFSLQYRNFDDDTLFGTQFLPPVEIIGPADGSTTVFSSTLDRTPVLKRTVVVDYITGGTSALAVDDGNGNIIGDGVSSGTIDYTTGAVSVTFSTAPDNGTNVTTTYFMDVEA